MSYSELVTQLRKDIPNFKVNKDFHENKKKIIEEFPDLVYKRKLDPNNPKSPQKNFFKLDIITKLKKLYK